MTQELPPAAVLIALLQRARLDPSVLDVYAPEIDEPVDVPTLAGRLGLLPATIYRDRARGRWPDPLPLPGRTPLWTYRDVIVYRAQMPGKGRWRAEVNKPLPETGSSSD